MLPHRCMYLACLESVTSVTPLPMTDFHVNLPLSATDGRRGYQQISYAAIRADASSAFGLGTAGPGRLSPVALADHAYQGGSGAEARLGEGRPEEGLPRPQLSGKGEYYPTKHKKQRLVRTDVLMYCMFATICCEIYNCYSLLFVVKRIRSMKWCGRWR